MTNIHQKQAGWARKSSRWSRANSAGARNVLLDSTKASARRSDGLERASESISPNCTWCPRPDDVNAGGTPATRPAGVRDPRVLLFPIRRAPHREGGDGTGNQETAEGPMSGMTVLVVEDDFIVAYDMQMMLEEQGARVLGPASSLEEAQELVRKERPTVAVLDVNLNGDYVFPLAAELLAKEVPFLFATAYADDERMFPQATRSAPRLAKPVLPNVLIAQLMRLKP
jgi:CheY-like chemotaxis protein